MNSASPTNIKVLRLRLKDKHANFLNDLAREVNFVWNYCNDLQITMFNRERRFLSGFDFSNFTRGATKEGSHGQPLRRQRTPSRCSMRAGRPFERCSGINALSQG
jgi:hypothetical protein